VISVIFCSIDDRKAQFTETHYRQLLAGEEHEIIVIRDARSLAEAYNRGIDRARGDILIFSHDDLEFLQPAGWLAKLTAHLEAADIVGVAGTRRFSGAAWAHSGPPFNAGQVAEVDGKIASYRILMFSAPAAHVAGIQALDGLFIAARRSVLDRVRFDAATFDGFHCYDVDFSFSAWRMGFKLAVATDLPVLHASQGSFDDKWRHYAQLLIAKHRDHIGTVSPRRWQTGIVWVNSRQEILEILSGGVGLSW
jgi:GT2 family glycosyltransferase